MMNRKQYLHAFIDDCKYYDPEHRELKTILKHVDVKRKTILDIGTGIGRLAFPLAKYATKIIAIDKETIFKKYFQNHQRKNITFINTQAETYLKKHKKFDILLIAWPPINTKLFTAIKNALHNNNLCIFITCDDTSEWETIIDNLSEVNKKKLQRATHHKNKLLKTLPKKFHILLKKKIKTFYAYPNPTIALHTIHNSLHLWFQISFNHKTHEELRTIINHHKKGKRIIFKEQIWFYVLTQRPPQTKSYHRNPPLPQRGGSRAHSNLPQETQ